ncbi:TonB-dependent receptor plug domain-containing protein [Pseudobacteriovorax antillogorgiicola]|uniref:Outer membrane receptor proteins, mostly Fe transport n=1 Tax=Pseudobacteriovorax antillogorgiicola TaxID=1513793 RepID=A0A1Y6C3F3_9BACT|nr:TonB-dependent receptor [Pseudobacteriovorax antillogorgiicola]TCS43374.1 outer membrane receptor protein involved in Fe transport [Pseudobacteriovorax antillogorgiicola]SMF35025.1 Outer membrane receptor proteins, mostly Fe transport [Pseudobacteriovorax antillogorgiicola]
MNIHFHKPTYLPLATLICVGLLPVVGLAQESSDQKKVEKFTVTGSRIKRVDSEGPISVKVIDREEISKSGATSLNGLLNNLSSSSFGAQYLSAGFGDADFQSVDLRGLGADKTLVLINGRRLPKDGRYQIVDLSTIPLSAIERVEIAKGGASAVYGSDAMAGVVNIITRSDGDGGEVGVKQTLTTEEGGETTEAHAAYGYVGNRIQTLTAINYKKTERVRQDSREWFDSDPATTIGRPANYVGNDGALHAPTNCPEGQINSQDGRPDRCTGDYFSGGEGSDYTSESSKLSLFQLFEYGLTDDLSVYGQIVASRKNTRAVMGPNFISSSAGIKVGADVAQQKIDQGILDESLVVNEGGDVEDLTISYLFDKNRAYTANTDNLGLSAGLKGSMLDATWDWDFNISKTSTWRRNDQDQGAYIESAMTEAIRNGSYDVFSNEAQDDSGFSVSTKDVTYSTIEGAELSLTGELFELPTGYVYAAIGASFHKEKFQDLLDPYLKNGDLFGTGGNNASGSRDRSALFAELSIPTIDRMEVTLAGRVDNYSDFGTAFNPMASIKYSPIDSLLLRTSFGQGFKAPDLTDLYKAEGKLFGTIDRDLALCQTGEEDECEGYGVEIVSKGNEDLEEETSQNFGFGFVFEPSNQFNFAFDYYNIEIENQIKQADATALVDKAFRDGDGSLPDGVVITRDETTGRVTSIFNPYVNTAALKTSGLDLNLKAKSEKYTWGQLNLTTDYTYVLSYKQEQIAGQGFEELIEKNTTGDKRPRWRMSNTLFYSYDVHGLGLTNRQISGYDKSVAESGRVGSSSMWDMQYAYNAFFNGSVAFGVNNLLNTIPPKDETDGRNFGIEDRLHSSKGREFYISATQKL